MLLVFSLQTEAITTDDSKDEGLSEGELVGVISGVVGVVFSLIKELEIY